MKILNLSTDIHNSYVNNVARSQLQNYKGRNKTCVIPLIRVILPEISFFIIILRFELEKNICGIIFVIQGDLLGQKVNLKVKFLKNIFFNKYI